MTALWLCLRLPRLALEAFPPVVQPAVVAQRQRALACNAAAAAAGIAPGMSLATVHARCPGIMVSDRCCVREHQALRALAHWCYRFTPVVSLHIPTAASVADSLMLEISGCLRLFRGLSQLLALVGAGLEEQGYSHAMGLAPTPGAAWLLSWHPDASARWAAQGFDDGDGAVLADPDQPTRYGQRLDAVSLRHLDCSPAVKEQFAPAGFRCLGELLRLPRPALGRRYGKALLVYLEQVIGQRPDPRPALPLPERFASALEFDAAITVAERLLFPMRRLLLALSGYLHRSQRHCSALQWRLGLRGGGENLLELPLSRPQNDAAHFLALSRLRLESLQLDEPVERLALEVGALHPACPERRDLFGDRPGEAGATAFAELCDRLGTRLGAAAVSGLAVADSHIPEQSWQVLASGASRPASDPAAVLPPLRPLWLFPTPAPIRVRGRQLYWRGALVLVRGPERIDSGWWQPVDREPDDPLASPVQRDYFVARDPHGALYWIYRDRPSRRWFVHGAFG